MLSSVYFDVELAGIWMDFGICFSRNEIEVKDWKNRNEDRNEKKQFKLNIRIEPINKIKSTKRMPNLKRLCTTLYTYQSVAGIHYTHIDAMFPISECIQMSLQILKYATEKNDRPTHWTHHIDTDTYQYDAQQTY